MGVPAGILTLVTFPAIGFKALPSPFSQIDFESLLSFVLFQLPRPPWLLANSYQSPPRMSRLEASPASSPPLIQHISVSFGPHRNVCTPVGLLSWSTTKQLFIGTCYLHRHCFLICTGFSVSRQLRGQEPCLRESINSLLQCLTGCPAPSEAKECWVLESGPAGSQFQLHRLRTAALWQVASSLSAWGSCED
ncbi:hypothetical protein HJG60_010044 [Phyllostomus discolor]|uniref:Uncharacterized protein n=1 Tax=Phyllostomus discolor TaxID=89673 RepID=A0A834AXM7_9CHIR|nr:hypothetical protein HJG60_010044 [Phyllostomus discolor]